MRPVCLKESNVYFRGEDNKCICTIYSISIHRCIYIIVQSIEMCFCPYFTLCRNLCLFFRHTHVLCQPGAYHPNCAKCINSILCPLPSLVILYKISQMYTTPIFPHSLCNCLCFPFTVESTLMLTAQGVSELIQ